MGGYSFDGFDSRLYNQRYYLIDGIDGLASGLSCIALTVLAAICISNGSYFYALLALATLGILIPFWFYNVFGNAQRGHKLFMGDTGSLTIGISSASW